MIVNPHRVGVLESRHQVRPRKFRRKPIGDDDQIASFWDRASALLVDAIVGASVWFVLVFLLAVNTSADWQLAMVISIIFVPVYALAVSLLVAIRGQSPGKIFGGLKIVRADGMDIGFGRGILRESIGKLISVLPLVVPLGFLWALFDSKNQGWHDKIADTIVIRVR